MCFVCLGERGVGKCDACENVRKVHINSLHEYGKKGEGMHRVLLCDECEGWLCNFGNVFIQSSKKLYTIY